MKDFFRRTASGIVFMILMMASLWFHEYSLLALLVFILIVGLYEFFTLVGKKRQTGFVVPGGLTAITGLILSFLVAGNYIQPNYLLFLPLVFLLIPLTVILYRPFSFRRSYFSTMAGSLYLSVPLSAIVFICFFSGEYDYRLMYGFFFILWTYDSFAYLSGVSFGKHKIFPRISPKKTWEGFIGGLISAFIIAMLIPLWFQILDVYQWLIISLIIVITGTIGDFAESWLKRKAGVKDSGNLIPGHGGILDRFDSVLFSVPFVYLYLEFL